MPLIIPYRARLLFVLAGFIASLVSGVLVAVAQTPTPEQLQMFQGLSPTQQQAALAQLAGGSGSGSSSASGLAASRARPDTARSAADEAARRAAERRAVEEPLIPVLKAEDVVLVEVELPKERLKVQSTGPNSPPVVTKEPVEFDPVERKRLTELKELIRSRNPYRLDRSGQLVMPGFAPIALAGLNDQQATQRLSAEPVLLNLEIKFARLPLAKAGLEVLKPFGYDLFDEEPSTFAPVTDVPVPADYIVGPGDELSVQLFGSQNRNLRLVVSREGAVSFPELGPIPVAGQSFSAAKAAIEARVGQQMIGVRASVSMGDVRSIRVFVLGEARRPGSYTVSGLATMTTALFASGGVRPIGSLRNIQLKRQGAVVRRLDLYDLLIQGNTSDDAKLQPGDVIFIPPVGSILTVAGEVKRPAIYELRGESNLADALRIAGGLTPDADASRGSLQRVDEQSRRVIIDVNLNRSAGGAQVLRNGDVLRIERLRPQLDSGVMLDGFVHRPGARAWRDGLRISELLPSIDELKPNADLHYVLIRREAGADRHVEVLSADLTAALAASGSAADVALMPRDQVTVFDLAPGRERIIKPLLDELRLQSALSRPTEVVHVSGRIKAPGEYPLEAGMKVSDLLRAGGNLDPAAYGAKAELIRYEVSSTGARQTEVVQVDLAAVRSGSATANLLLKPFDSLLIQETSNWSKQEQVTLAGEVRFPGVYPIRRGETLRELLDRAGGLTPFANPKGGVLTRQELREQEQKQLDLLSDRMQADLAAMSLQAAAANQAGASASITAGQSLLGQLKQTQAVGRLVIDLPGLVANDAGSSKDVLLKNGDALLVPQLKQEVTVIGEVQSVTSHLYAKSRTRDEYINLSGGLTRKADKSKIYVVRADGSVVASSGSMFRRNIGIGIQPGDSIVVPLDSERIPKLPMWQAVTQIIYNLTVAFAAIKTF